MKGHVSLPPVRTAHRAGIPHHEEEISTRTEPSVTASLISLQRLIGNARVMQLLRAESPLIELTTVPSRVQRDGYGLDEGWGDVKATDASYGSSQSSEYGASSESGYGYGLDEGWRDAEATDASHGSSQSSEYSDSSESGYGYGFSDDPLAAGGFGSTEDW